MAKDAAVTMDRVFSMTNPLVFGRISAETPDEATEGRPPVFAPSLSQSGFHRCTVKKCSNRNFYTMKKRAIQRPKGSFSRRCCTNITGTASECVSDAKSGRNLRVRQPIFWSASARAYHIERQARPIPHARGRAFRPNIAGVVRSRLAARA
jgi:hypothetical protein